MVIKNQINKAITGNIETQHNVADHPSQVIRHYGILSSSPLTTFYLLLTTMYPIFGLIGPSGAGKTTLTLEMLKRFPELTPIRSLVTRPPRETEEDQLFHFVRREDIERCGRESRLLQKAEYGGNLYATDRIEVANQLQTHFGIFAVVEKAIADFENAGFHVITIKIIPEHAELGRQDEKRRADDAARATRAIRIDHTIMNSFEPGGKEKATEALTKLIASYLPSTPLTDQDSNATTPARNS